MPRIRKNNTHDATPAPAQKNTAASTPHNTKQPDSLPAAEYAKKHNLTNILKVLEVLEADTDLADKIEKMFDKCENRFIFNLSNSVRCNRYEPDGECNMKEYTNNIYNPEIRKLVQSNAETIKSKLGEAFQDQTPENVTETVTTAILQNTLARIESEINSIEKHYIEFIPSGTDKKQLLEKMIKEILEPLHSLAYNTNNNAATRTHLKTFYDNKRSEKKQAEIQKNIEESLKRQGQMNNDEKTSIQMYNNATQTVEKNQDAAQYKKFESLIDRLYLELAGKSKIISQYDLNNMLKETYDLKGKKLVLRVYTNPQSTQAEKDRFIKDLQILVKYSEEKENEKLDKRQASIDELKMNFKEDIAKLEAEASDYAKKHKLINILEVFKAAPDLKAKIKKKHGEYEAKMIKAIESKIEANRNKTTPDTKDIEDFANATNQYAEDIRTLVKPEADEIKSKLGEDFKNQKTENVTETITTAILQNSLAKSQSDAFSSAMFLLARKNTSPGTNEIQLLKARIDKMETITTETLKPLISLTYNKNNYDAAKEFYNKQVIIKQKAESTKNIEKFSKKFETDNAKLYRDAKATEHPLKYRTKIIELEEKKYGYALKATTENLKLNDAKVEKYKGMIDKFLDMPEDIFTKHQKNTFTHDTGYEFGE